MKKPKLTRWFKSKVKPSRVGVYLIRFGRDPLFHSVGDEYAFWNGKRWSWAQPSIRLAAQAAPQCSRPSGAAQDKEWRGLAADPNAS